MNIGFTGTSAGMTYKQKNKLCDLINELKQIGSVTHGDCVGGDFEFHDMIYSRFPGVQMIIRPCTIDKMRAYSHLNTPDADYVIEDPIAPLKRNDIIVQTSDIMFAAPPTMLEQSRGGTWYTIRKARKALENGTLNTLLIIFPDGSFCFQINPFAYHKRFKI